MVLSTDISGKNLVAAIVLLLSGALIGGAVSVGYMDQRMDSLNQKIEQTNGDGNTVYINSEQSALTQLFQETDQSVVSITTVGGQNTQGSGFVYDESGYIVTNEHVIEDAQRVEVTFLDGDNRNARIVGTDPYTDLVVLKVNKRGLEPLELGNSSEVRVGQRAAAIGNPFGLQGSMTSGIISQKGRTLRTEGGFSTPNVLQTDAAINPGNSGGPLLNIQGEVVGVNTAIESDTGVFSGVGFAIPSSTVERVVPELIQYGDYEHPWIGVRGFDVNQDIAEKMNLENSTGFLVTTVASGGPAEQAGIRPAQRNATIDGGEIEVGGDVITAINGQTVRGISDILLYLSREAEVGETVTLTVVRDGERVEVPLKLQSRADAPQNQ